jgi:hypothetical protein
MKHVVTILAMVAGPAVAQDRAAVLIGSYHVGAERGEFNESNPGLFLTWGDWTVGAYHNSYGDMSVAVTREWALTDHVDFFAGVATYDGLMPLAGLQLHAGPFFMQVIPSDGRYVDAILSFGLVTAIGQ